MSSGSVEAVASARPRKPRTRWTVWASLLAVVAMTAWAALEPLGGIGFTIMPALGPGIARGSGIIAEFFSPNWSFIPRIWGPLLETFLIAVIATSVGVLLALPLAMLASKVTGVGRITYAAVKTFNSVIRSLPDVAWGLLAAAAVGTGALAGIIALVFFNIGVMVKLVAETVDAVDTGPVEAASASGANRLEASLQAVVPQILPNYVSYSLYVFELNIRASVVIGLVGGGGIGNVIRVELTRRPFSNLAAVIVVLFVVVFVLDRVSIMLRRRLV